MNVFEPTSATDFIAIYLPLQKFVALRPFHLQPQLALLYPQYI